MPAALNLPTKACHNCRKKRWKCDRSFPGCQKCLSSGSECLGYGKLLIWNQGVARRGKMMGKTFQDVNGTKQEIRAHAVQEMDARPRAILKPDSKHNDQVPDAQPHRFGNDRGTTLSLFRSLLDPLIQDLAQNHRYYLYHFANQLCADMVIYDGPGQNPIRDVIPQTKACPLLLQIIIANSAQHVYNISQIPAQSLRYQQERRPCLLTYYREATRFGGPLTTAFYDALVAKQNALELLAQLVASVGVGNIDLILVAILLFINYNLIESGTDNWQVHMEGARRLIELLGRAPYVEEPMSRLRTCLLSDFLVFFVLGSTLKFSSSADKSLLPQSIADSSVLQYAETNNYLSCPAPLLRIMLKSFELPDMREAQNSNVAEEVQERVRELLEAALAFDPTAWSRTFRPACPFEDLGKRIRIASAHRAAVCIYVARVLPSSNPLINQSSSAIVSLTSLADEIVHHVSYLKPGDILFKSTSWPLFLAGAESEDATQRMWILKRLDALWHEMYWGYISTVKNVLEVIWSRKDRSEELDNCWVTEVKKLGTELLIA